MKDSDDEVSVTEQNIYGQVGRDVIGNVHVHHNEQEPWWQESSTSELRRTIKEAQRRQRSAIFTSYVSVYSVLFAGFTLAFLGVSLKMMSFMPNSPPNWIYLALLGTGAPMMIAAHYHGQIRRTQSNVIAYTNEVIELARLELELRRG